MNNNKTLFVLATRPKNSGLLRSAATFMIDEVKVKERVEKSETRYKQLPANTQSLISLLESGMEQEEQILLFLNKLVERGVRREIVEKAYAGLNDSDLYTTDQINTFLETDEGKHFWQMLGEVDAEYPEFRCVIKDYLEDCKAELHVKIKKTNEAIEVLTKSKYCKLGGGK